MKELPADWKREEAVDNLTGPSKFLLVEGIHSEYADKVRMTVLKERIKAMTDLAKDSESAEKMVEILEKFIATAVNQTWKVAFDRGVWTCQNFAKESKFEYIGSGGEGNVQ